ncbi:MAG: RadC family protein [Selenomonadaceae bacterium]
MMKATMVRDLPQAERPREKLLSEGSRALTNAELLAILLRTGTKEESVLHLAERILSRFKEQGIASLVNVSSLELSEIKGIGPAKALTILAAIEFGRRIGTKAAEQRQTIQGPEDVAAYAMPRLRYQTKEYFLVLLLNMKNQVLSLQTISVGSLSASIVHPREVFQAALRQSAAAVILIHNHPSGDPSPSQEDIAITDRLVQAGKLMDIPVLDHVVIGDNKYISLKEKGMVK